VSNEESAVVFLSVLSMYRDMFSFLMHRTEPCTTPNHWRGQAPAVVLQKMVRYFQRPGIEVTRYRCLNYANSVKALGLRRQLCLSLWAHVCVLHRNELSLTLMGLMSCLAVVQYSVGDHSLAPVTFLQTLRRRPRREPLLDVARRPLSPLFISPTFQTRLSTAVICAIF
jgi:hypothetical protein